MAGEDLYSALSGLNFTPMDSMYGIGAAGIGQSLPLLVNPYASTGKNLGMVLGGTLLSSLLGYQARKEANEQSMLTNRAALEMLATNDPAERLRVIESVPGGLMGSMSQERLLALNSRLAGQDTLAKALAQQQVEQRRQLAAFEMSPEGAALNELQNRREAQKQIAQQQVLNEFYSTEEGKAALASQVDRQRQLAIANAAGTIAWRNEQDKSRERKLIQDNELKKERAVFNQQLKLDNPDIPAAIESETGEATAVANLAMNLAQKVRQISSYPEFVGAKNLSSLGGGLKEEYEDIADMILRIRTGAAAPVQEQEKLLGIIQGTVEVGPELAADLIENWAKRSYSWSADRMAQASNKPSDVVKILRESAQRGTPAMFDVPTGSTTIGATPSAAAPAQDEEAKRQRNIELKARLARLEQLAAAQGK